MDVMYSSLLCDRWQYECIDLLEKVASNPAHDGISIQDFYLETVKVYPAGDTQNFFVDMVSLFSSVHSNNPQGERRNKMLT